MPQITPFFVLAEEKVNSRSAVKIKGLKRFDGVEKLKAWNGADRLLCETLKKEAVIPEGVIGDTFGALSLGWEKMPAVYTDSAQSLWFISTNAENRDDPSFDFHQLHSYEALKSIESRQKIVWKLPKSMDLAKWILDQLPLGIEIYAGGMDKYLPSTYLKLLKEYGQVHVYKGEYKAHAYKIHKTLKPQKIEMISYSFFQDKRSMVSHPGVFSAYHLDNASRLLLEQFPQSSAQNILDFGCGAGVLGIAWKNINRDAHITFLDDSSMALNSAKMNCELRGIKKDDLTFIHNFCLNPVEHDSHLPEEKMYDVILTNPPFHTGTDLQMGLIVRLLKEMVSRLKPHGELWLVIPRQFKCKSELQKLFSKVEPTAFNEKSGVYRCVL